MRISLFSLHKMSAGRNVLPKDKLHSRVMHQASAHSGAFNKAAFYGSQNPEEFKRDLPVRWHGDDWLGSLGPQDGFRSASYRNGEGGGDENELPER
jgi:hypothetical protein